MDMLKIVKEFQLRPWNFGDFAAVKSPCYTMLTGEEIRLLYWLTNYYYQPMYGDIIDAGCFIGGSTHALARGLIDAKKNATIRSFDLFKCGTYEGGLDILDKPGEGASFFEKYIENIKSVSFVVEVNAGDLTKQNFNNPIGILFLDCLKTPVVNDFVVENLFKLLQPGVSVVIQQDYIHEWLPWIHISMEVLKDYFVQLTHTSTNSVAYLLTEKIPDRILLSACYSRIDLNTRKKLHTNAIDRWNGRQREIVSEAGGRIY